jgi:hypothetical protein
MNLRRNRWLPRVGLVLIVGLGLLIWVLHQRAQRQLTVENRSGQPITELRVTVGGETTTFHNVATGKDVGTPLHSFGGQTFSLEGQLADGTLLKSKGTVEDEMRCVVLPGGAIEFRKPQRGGVAHP